MLLFGIYACENETSSPFPFTNLESSISGIHFSNDLIDTDSFNIMQYLYYYNGGGVAAGDLNNDGLVDLFFTGNQVDDALFINQGNLTFKDISSSSGIAAFKGWSTGVTLLDINRDGWLDIYVCRLGKYKIYDDHNRLYINNKDETFTESSKEYGLDFSGFSTQAAFFDYDKDGDLDCYLLNHSVKRPDQFVKANRIRYEADSLSGDRLLRNDNNHFMDVTEPSGIYSSNVGFGLSVCVTDLNGDSWPDLYIGNDFHENDYLYLNQKDGTFKEVIDQVMGHTSNFTMGSTVADINNDGGLDILSLDMQPNSEEIYKMSGGWESKQIYDFKREYGYHHQSPKNALQMYVGHNGYQSVYSEQASLYGLQASDWSWAPLIKDFDLDGDKDIYITNGIFKRPNDMDFVNYFSDPQNGTKSDLEMIAKMPSGLFPNQYFEQEDGQFLNRSTQTPTISNGACTADLDNDGDLDIIINNINEKASLLINTTNPKNYLKISLKGDSISSMAKSGIQFFAAYSNTDHKHSSILLGNNGFQSMDEAIAVLPHFQDSIHLVINYPDNYIGDYSIGPALRHFELSDDLLENREQSIARFNHKSNDTLYQHFENKFNDQNNEPLLLYNSSQLGPKIAHNEDEYIYIPQGKGKNGAILNIITEQVEQVLSKGSRTQLVDETDAVFFDADQDGDADLYVCIGGNELSDGDLALTDLLFINDQGNFVLNKAMLPKIPKNTSTVSEGDYDNDGDVDLFVGVQGKAGDYGNSTSSYLLENIDNKEFKAFTLDINEMVYDSEWVDLDNDGRKDLIIVGHWMPVTILFNKEGRFQKYEIPNSNGWWYSIHVDDFDGDGKVDILAGNFGQNHRLDANSTSPLKLYLDDFDTNGKSDPIISYHKEGIEYPYANLDLLLKQIPGKRKRFILHSDYAQLSIQDIFTQDELKNAQQKYTHTLSSSVFFQNDINKWEEKPLPLDLQLAPIWAFASHKNYILAGGNHFDIDPNLGRQDALPLTAFQFKGREIELKENYPTSLHKKEIRSLVSLGSNLIIGVNDGYILKQVDHDK